MSIPLETVTLEHIPPPYAIHLALYHGVTNASFLHEQLRARNTAFEYAFVDAAAIVSRNHLLSAVFRAVTTHASGALRTPNVHSEIVAALSPSNNIADAYRRFGVAPSTAALVVVKVTVGNVGPTPTEIADHLAANVDGTPLPATDENIIAVTDLARVRKAYKLNALPWLDAITADVPRRNQMEAIILGGMALRGI